MNQKAAINNTEVLSLIDAARSGIGITEYEMCKRAGISQGAFSNVKNNRRRLCANLARKLAIGLNIPAVQLFEAAGILPKL
jgi:transcriptional regulator with XRE-family HTH domain